jgi:hypothetical protein
MPFIQSHPPCFDRAFAAASESEVNPLRLSIPFTLLRAIAALSVIVVNPSK